MKRHKSLVELFEELRDSYIELLEALGVGKLVAWLSKKLPKG